MSRAFVKEGAPETPVVIPPRAPLPAGVPNYVTPTGLAALRTERADLERARAALDPTAPDAARQREEITGRLKALVERIAIAKLVDPAAVDPSRVRFGATVEIDGAQGRRTVQIVGVDEAAPDRGMVAFTSPVARAVLGKAVGDTATLTTPTGDEALAVAAVRYGPTSG